MQIKVKKSFNDFLDSSIFVNKYDLTRTVVKDSKKGNTLYLLMLLIVGSVITLLLDFITSVIGYNNPGRYLAYSLFTYLFCILMNNMIFYAFVRCVRHQKLQKEDLRTMIKMAGIQIVCAILLSLVQNFFLTAGVTALSFNVKVSVIVSIIITWFFTMLNAVVSFQIYDHKKGVKNLFTTAYEIVIDNWKVLGMISLLFLSWKFISSVAFTDIVATEIVQVQNINNVFHALLFAKNYAVLSQVLIYNVVNLIVAGYFEIYFLLALAYFYDLKIGQVKKVKKRKY